MQRFAIILAAGKGTRMKSNIEGMPKVAFPLLGKPMICYVLDALSGLRFDKLCVIAGYGKETVASLASPYGEIFTQEEQKGTADAVSAARALADKEGVTLVCSGDTPLLTDRTIEALLLAHETNHNDATVLTSLVRDPYGYGRIKRNGAALERIVSQKECTPELSAIHEVNTGVYAFDNHLLFSALDRYLALPAKEYHLSDIVNALINDGRRVGAFAIGDDTEALSVNDRYQLSVATKALRERINKRWMIHGVTFEDPDTAYVGPEVKLSRDTVIRSGVHIYGKSTIGHQNVIGPDCYFENVTIGERNKIQYCHLVDTIVDDDTDLGPYFRTRKGVHIHSKAHVGNFNEMKNVEFGEGSKCAHLSYLGDADIGEGVNVGCGTIIANYDGVNKFRSAIGDRVFLGSGSTIISPVHIGDEAFVAAGSTVNKDVPSGDMAIARAHQENKPGYAKVLKEKALAKKKK
ncbi:MAG: UDP-N-acetylglucosamine diphosphorylase/glucosamine-1-phosphate N-acetyltransferase [Erysipelotrichaceae bacterium]|nr:UDP-N-acetylglucosamine diphosphorylase/glucosamine-1-phosphate N-acetyltransferase [Erysipelotrichaceae bacterium]